MIKVAQQARKYLLDQALATNYGLWMYTEADIEEARTFILGGEKPIARILNPAMRSAIEILTGAELPREMRWFDIEMTPGDRILVMKKRKGVSLAFMAEDQWEPNELLGKFEFGVLWYVAENLEGLTHSIQ
jgi:hypothetical protein